MPAKHVPAAAALGVLGRSAARDEFALPAARVQWGEYVEAARREWLGYRAYFDCVDDPELIDHAIYSIQAAERKYMYLLRRARMAGIDLTAPVGPDAVPEDDVPDKAASVPFRATASVPFRETANVSLRPTANFPLQAAVEGEERAR